MKTIILGKDNYVGKINCLVCESDLSGAFSFGEKAWKLSPGALSICSYCGSIAVFNDDLKLRPMTPDEQERAFKDENVQLAKAAVRAVKRGRNATH